MSTFVEQTGSVPAKLEPNHHVKEAAAAARAAVARAQEATRNVSQMVTRRSSWDELYSDIAQLTEIACSHHVLLMDLIEGVAALEAIVGVQGRRADGH